MAGRLKRCATARASNPTTTPTPLAGACLGAVAAVLEQAASSEAVGRIAEGLLFYMGFPTPLDGLDPARAREDAALSLFAFTEAYLKVRPVVVVLSDLHWADDLVLELLDRMLRALGGLPFVVVATARVDQDFRWRPQGRHNTVAINLDPLDRIAARQLLDSVAEARLPRRVADQLLDRSGGNPFFLEELASLICDSADVGEDLPELPDNIRGLVAARLDTLSPGERATLEDAAVLGRSGPVTALATLAVDRVPIDAPAKFDDDGRDALGGLVSKDLLFLEGDRWTFRSESVREVAYNTLTKASRARRHAAIAELFINDEALGRGERLEQVAVHLAAASELVAELGPIPGVPDDVRARAAGCSRRQRSAPPRTKWRAPRCGCQTEPCRFWILTTKRPAVPGVGSSRCGPGRARRSATFPGRAWT